MQSVANNQIYWIRNILPLNSKGDGKTQASKALSKSKVRQTFRRIICCREQRIACSKEKSGKFCWLWNQIFIMWIVNPVREKLDDVFACDAHRCGKFLGKSSVCSVRWKKPINLKPQMRKGPARASKHTHTRTQHSNANFSTSQFSLSFHLDVETMKLRVLKLSNLLRCHQNLKIHHFYDSWKTEVVEIMSTCSTLLALT